MIKRSTAYIPPLPQRKRDRFGLPPPRSFLGETPEQERARIAAVEHLVADVFKTTVQHCGRPGAKRLFAAIAKDEPKGKQADHEQNRKLLKMFDAVVGEAPNKRKYAATIAAKRLFAAKRLNLVSVKSTARQIRKLVTEREAARPPRSLLTSDNTEL